MGAYLDKPIVEKEREEGNGDGFKYACTSMQGWRANQEDAHNAVVNLHEGWHMFAVYDGHGGSEVSKFTAARFPEFLKTKKFWDVADPEACLKKAFVDFDDFIRSEESLKELTVMANEGRQRTDEDDSEDEADRIGTIEERDVPLQELIAKYGKVSAKSLLSAFLQKREEEGEDDDDNEDADDTEDQDDDEGEEKEEEEEMKDEENENEEGESEQAPEKNQKKRCNKSPTSHTTAKKAKSDENTVDDAAAGDSEAKKEEKSENDAKSSGSKSVNAFAYEEEDEEDEEEFIADEDISDEEMDDEEDEDEGDFQNIMLNGGAEKAGEDSGTTACVCLIGNKKIIVANAGDSRAVLCRAGKAVDLSVDHKPEDEVETERITKAGGCIEDGRVNGGLNLSRALGDHSYKKNEALELKDQMITALPDVKVENLTDEDEFLVVACDGIWNSLESQQVVDFVRERLAQGKSCAEICDDLCDACLAESTYGDGTGCDNMTVICTQFVR